MKIIKRSGRSVNFNPNNITKRIKDQSYGLNVNPDEISIKVISQITDGITTKQLDQFTCEICATSACKHPDYNILASRIFVTGLWKDTPDTFSECVSILSEQGSVLDPYYINFVNNNSEQLNQIIVNQRDFNHDFFGLKTLERAYLLKTSKDFGNIIVERPQYMWLRVALVVNHFDINKAKETYELLSSGYYTHATPTLFNSATKHQQLSSCFLIANQADSIDGLFDTLKDVGKISKWAGGIGLHIHNVRSKGSHIYSTGGDSDGIVPMLKTYNEVARWINQGGKRKGSFAIYIEPWHADIYDFLDLKKNHGKEEMRARDLFYAIWNPDLFMTRVENNDIWTLFDPNAVSIWISKNRKDLWDQGVRGLQDVHNEQFNLLYDQLERSQVGKSVNARELWEKITVSQIETGMPYMLYKDAVNRSNNQSNVDMIRSSNLCTEIVEVSNKDHQAVCNLASIALPKFVKDDNSFDFDKLGQITRHITERLDNVIDVNYYPTDKTQVSNNELRPIGIGVQGLADVFAMMKIAFDSDEAKGLNTLIFECIYYNALYASSEIAKQKGVYPKYRGSNVDKGLLHFDTFKHSGSLISILDWNIVRDNIKKNGVRNSLLVAPMPTASTSQILGNNECFEPFTSNMYVRRTLAGEFIVINKHLVKDLLEIGLWDSWSENQLKLHNGSVQNIEFHQHPNYIYEPGLNIVIDQIKKRYKTAYEISQKVIIDMAKDRQVFIDQSQSMNLFMENANVAKVTSMHFYAWKSGLKTGMYYLRTKAAVDAIKFTAQKDPNTHVILEQVKSESVISNPQVSCSLDDPDNCDMCGS